MLWKIGVCFSIACSVFAQEDFAKMPMLHQANLIAKKYADEIAKSPAPPLVPQAQNCLDAASIWFSLDLSEIAAEGESTLQALSQESFWDSLKEIGVQAVRLSGLKKGGSFRTGLSIDPKWGTEQDWQSLSSLLEKKGISLILDLIGNATGVGADFGLALKNSGDYPGLYHLIEIPKADWKLLPPVPQGQFFANVPWLTLQDLHGKGYVPEQFDPYIRQSAWNATLPITGTDGKPRRWIYLKQNNGDPVIDWLDSSFAGSRIAAADAIDSTYRLGAQILHLDAKKNPNTQETLSLWIRKLGAFSAQEVEGGVANLQNASADLIFDALTRPALLHALIAEDAEALKLSYRLFLESEIPLKSLVHVLQPFDTYVCDWAELLHHPKKKFAYHEESLTGEVLRRRLIREDIARLGGGGADQVPLSTWAGYCASALGVDDARQHKDQIAEVHLLLAFFYAMQPGAFSFSLSDLYGALPNEKAPLQLTASNDSTLYSTPSLQLKSPRSFASHLRQILRVRKESGLESGDLVSVPATPHRSVLLLVLKQRGTGFPQLLAINFGRQSAQELIEMPAFRKTTAIDLMTGVSEGKPFDSPSLLIDLPPLTGKIILFQSKYYN